MVPKKLINELSTSHGGAAALLTTDEAAPAKPWPGLGWMNCGEMRRGQCTQNRGKRKGEERRPHEPRARWS